MDALLRVILVLTQDASPAFSRARSSLMLLSLLVIDQHFTVLAKAMRLVLCSPYHREDVLGLVENRVHLFERAISGLRVEKVNDREDESIASIHR